MSEPGLKQVHECPKCGSTAHGADWSIITHRAAIFPMMSAEELAELAADIKENGQRFPIVGKYEDRELIVDGRNRYEACEMAGVEPKFEKLNGHDAKAFILSVNVNRRHLNAGQRRWQLQ